MGYRKFSFKTPMLLRLDDERPGAPQRHAAWTVFVIFAAVAFVLVLRLHLLHFTPGEKLLEEQDFHVVEIPITEPRGEIFDRNGVILATNREAPSLWVDPRKVPDDRREAVAALISERIGLSPEDARAALVRTGKDGKDRKFAMLKRWMTDLPDEEAKRLQDETGGAVQVVKETVRHYPHKDAAAHLLGYVNRSGELCEGVEKAYNAHLKSRAGMLRARADTRRRPLSSETLDYREAEGGELLQLTIDLNIQHNLESALDARMAETEAKEAMGVVMNPKTGEIYALASRPAFNPNDYDKFPAELRKNRALVDVFEPGSAFKIVAAAAALEHGLITPNTMINCEGGRFNPYGHSIGDFHKLGVEPFWKCFEESSNIAIIKVAAMLGEARMEEWIRRFGFAAPTSRDFPGESIGLFRPRAKWSKLSMGALPMGQEISVTTLQLARAFAVLANDGRVVEPYFVERAVARDGQVTYQHESAVSERILSPRTVETMRMLCHQAVLHGTGQPANMMEYRAGGKTGTAQMAKVGGGGYDASRYTAVFAGFAPVRDPQIVAAIVIQEPNIRLRYGGYVCGPVFKKVVGEALASMNVPGDPVTDPELVAKHMKEKAKAEKEKLAKNPKGKPAAAKAPAEPEPVEAGDADTASFIPIDESLSAMITPLDGLELVARNMGDRLETSLPDLAGLTKRQARERLQRLGVPMDAQGEGWVVAQNPPPGTALGEDLVCRLEFARRGAPLPAEDTVKQENEPQPAM